MRSLILVLMFVAAAIMAEDNIDSGSSGIEIVEVFRAETTEELEAALTDGYPMPWLEDILSDESIPEEDRYWLDCRVRAEIAQDLQLFFNEDGEPIHYEADRIRSGEDYWRECFIINLPGQDSQVSNPPEGQNAGVGILVDRYGNTIGEVAVSNAFSQLSRDGSVGVTQSGIQDMRSFGPGLMNLCFFYPDRSFIEFPIHHYRITETVSQSGRIVAASCYDRDSADGMNHRLYVFDNNANLIFEKILELRPSNSRRAIAISSDDEYLAVSTLDLPTGRYPVMLYDVKTGEVLHEWDLTLGNILSFSPDSRYLCIAGGGGAGIVVDCESGEVIWSRFLNEPERGSEIEQVRNLYCTNDVEIVYWLATEMSSTEFWPMLSDGNTNITVTDSIFGRPSISPNGYFYVAQRYLDIATSAIQETPFTVIILQGGE